MRHHFGDFLDRDCGYWTIVPNRERYAYRIGDVREGSREVTIVTIGKEDEHWSRVLTLPNLEEMTLHYPTNEQLVAIGKLDSIKRLRITHARPQTIEFISSMESVEELVLEYVSGFSDLAPLRHLKRLRALHMENLRGVSDLNGLSGLVGLKYLAVYGTTDWKQPIDDFEFLRGLSALEVFALWQVINKTAYPALLPALSLKKLKKLGIHGSYLHAEEYALLEEALAGVEGADWGPLRTVVYSKIELLPDDVRAHLPLDVLRSKHPEVMVRYDGKRMIDNPEGRWFEFTGKGAGKIKCGSAKAETKCREYSDQYVAMKERARLLVQRQQFC